MTTNTIQNETYRHIREICNETSSMSTYKKMGQTSTLANGRAKTSILSIYLIKN